MFQVKLTVNTANFLNSTLIMPTVCVGNVAQLAVDLLINSVKSEKIGYIYTSFLHPLVGAEALSGGRDKKRGSLSTACEIYRCVDSTVFIMQQRSPIIKGCSTDFCSHLRTWIKESGFDRVLILTASFAHHRSDAELAQTSLCRFLTSESANKDRETLESELKWNYMDLSERCEDELGCWKPTPLPGSGIAYPLLKQCSEDDIRAVLCLIFCSEGNNIPEAAHLASYVNQWIQLSPISVNSSGKANWVSPASWKLMYGREAATTLF